MIFHAGCQDCPSEFGVTDTKHAKESTFYCRKIPAQTHDKVNRRVGFRCPALIYLPGVILCGRELASSPSTIVQKEIGRVGVIDWVIELNVYSVELVETNLYRRNFNAGAMDGVGMAVEGGRPGPSGGKRWLVPGSGIGRGNVELR